MGEKTLDERRGLPSASAIYRLSNCPGSHALIAELGAQNKLVEDNDADREAGIRIHAHLAGTNATLVEEEIRTAQKCEELRDALINDWRNKGV